MAGFAGDPNAGKSGRITAQAPFQKLFWKDLSVMDLASAGRYIVYIYQVIASKGTFDDKGVPTLTYFNRSILATQASPATCPSAKRPARPMRVRC
ncbi:hypothetical protein EVC45_42165 [Paraburkholderia sp. UYCP14C]|uniref:hypothetical protein n=1 Tax=Paraburkholderia sp. UYCP14C TaxID=2511130 RepID=UPI0010219AA7|nr:hypothetical protein [Paraburkholderia sp. UYCP14C]RZF23822.1 hypothetical protein EVC45_42165 [Paraburkholderia sp. UYCP14C]